MAKVNAARQGFLTKSALPSVTRARGPTPVVNGAAIVITGNGATGDADQRRFQDRSIYNYPLYEGENVTMVNYGPFANFGGQSFNLNGYSGMALNGPAAFSFGTGDFTIEFFARSRNWNLTTTIQLFFSIGSGVNHLDIRVQSSQLRAVLGTTDPAITGATLSVNTWHHIALVRSAGTTRLYLNGTQTGSSVADSRNYICRGIGTDTPEPILFTDYSFNFNSNSHNAVYGWVSNMRVCNVAVYTGNFAAPTNNLQNSGAASAASYSVTTNVNTSFANTACLLLLAHGNAGDSAILTDASGQSSGGAYTAIYNAGTNPALLNWGKSALTSLSPYAASPGSYMAGPSFDTAEIFGSTVDLYAPDNAEFTVEFWAYIAGNTGNSFILYDSRESTSVAGNVVVTYNPITGQFTVGNGAAPTVRLSGSSGKLPYTWYHIAVVRISNVLRLYVNGVSEGGTFADSTAYNGRRINFGVGGVTNIQGTAVRAYISDLRLVIGKGIYTGTFTPPTSRLANSGAASAASYPSTTNVDTAWPLANCRLLISCAYPSASIRSETEPTVYEPKPIYANNVTVDTTITKTGTGSLNFGNSATSGASVYLPGNWRIEASTNFTIEGWFYFNTYAGTQQLWQVGTQLVYGGNQVFRLVSTGGSLGLCNSSTTIASIIFTFGSLPGGKVGQWQHIAICRVGTAIRCYLDGVQFGSDYTQTAQMGNQFGFFIGNGYTTGSGAWPTNAFRGYIDDFRVVNNATIYALPFTPPTTVATSNVSVFSTTTNSVYGAYQNF